MIQRRVSHLFPETKPHIAIQAMPPNSPVGQGSDAGVMTAPVPEKPTLQLQREIALANSVVGFQILDASRVNDLAFVDDGGMAGEAEAEMHVLFRDQNRRTRAAQLP
jgi:hypothetical protein